MICKLLCPYVCGGGGGRGGAPPPKNPLGYDFWPGLYLVTTRDPQKW